MNPKNILKKGVKTDSGSMVYSIPELPAETRAALHALNSRESGGFKENISKVFDNAGKLVKRILGTFYVGYGHKSIGDCGPADVFIDGVSMLCANAFEHWPLFNGQETSSRYVDVTVNGCHIPDSLCGTDAENWINSFLDFYQKAQPKILEKIRKDNPFDPLGNQKEIEWEKATASRSFDIAGAFLPCAAKTNFSQVMNLRQWSDQLQILVHHPLKEIAQNAKATLNILATDHPNSFRVSEREDKSAYNRLVAKHLFGGEFVSHEPTDYHTSSYGVVRDSSIFASTELFENRPVGCEIPFDMARLGGMYVTSLVDYRSYRDLHRHRSCVWVMPIVTPENGFEEWYLGQLPNEIREEAEKIITDYFNWWESVVNNFGKDNLQYSTPMGFRVPTEVYIPLTSFVYIPELRSKLAVHPTARKWAIKVGKDAQRMTKGKIPIHLDESPDKFCPERGKHDIVRKDS